MRTSYELGFSAISSGFLIKNNRKVTATTLPYHFLTNVFLSVCDYLKYRKHLFYAKFGASFAQAINPDIQYILI